MRKYAVLLCVVLLAMLGAVINAQDEEPFTLTIMHTNDTHATHEPDGNGNGGVALLAAVVKQIRAEAENSVLLDGGDRFTGTLYHTVYKGQDQIQVMNLLGYDAMSLGNHEFDSGDDILAQFLDGVNFPVLAANLDTSASPLLADKVQPYVILEVGGQQIGVIGLVTADTVGISSPGPELVFSDDYATIVNGIVDELEGQGINKIILVTHTGITADQEFAAQLSGVDVFVGGHSHTLYSNAYAAGSGDYPVEFTDADGGTIYYVQAGEKTTYLGRLNVTFDAAGVVTAAAGDTILLSRYITPDAEAAALISTLLESVVTLRDQETGATATELINGDRVVCRVEECAMGNIIADAMRAETGAQIALMNGGGVRASIDAGPITVGDVLTVQPFSNTMATFELSGADLIAALENGVFSIVVNDDGTVSREGLAGRFAQVSGMRYTFNPTLEPGSRIVSAEILNEDGSYSPIDSEVIYSVVTNNFVRLGGDFYTVLAENAINPYDFGRTDWEVLADYIAAQGEISPVVEGRIIIEGAELPPLE